MKNVDLKNLKFTCYRPIILNLKILLRNLSIASSKILKYFQLRLKNASDEKLFNLIHFIFHCVKKIILSLLLMIDRCQNLIWMVCMLEKTILNCLV